MRLAYVEPDGGGNGDMTFVPEGETHSYRSDLRLEDGLYEVDYTVKQGEKGVRVYDIYYLNEASPAAPQTPGILYELIEEITGFADKIVDRLAGGLKGDTDAERVQSAMEKIKSRDWLETITGIGPSHSESLKEKFEQIAPEELDVYAAFCQHGLPYNRGNAREQWACALMSHSAEELSRFQSNPYHLLRIGDENRKAVRRAAEANPKLQVMQYTLRWIDRHVGEEWEDSPERAKAHLEAATRSVFQNGHTVVRPEQIAENMQAEGFKAIDAGQNQRQEINPQVVENFARESSQLQRQRYVTHEGEYAEGYTTEYKRHQARQYSTVLGQMLQFDQPFSESEKRKMIQRALDAPYELDSTQKSAVRHAFHSRVSGVTGSAGTGKTLTTQRILNGAARLLEGKRTARAMGEDYKRPAFSIYVLAPSGKAAKQARAGLSVTMPNGRVVEPEPINQEKMPQGKPSEGVFQAGTVHSFLGYRGIGQWNVPDPHPAVVVIDEASMLTLETAYWVGRFFDALAIREMPGLLLKIGDSNQLPPVGAGAPFRDSLGKVGDSVIPSTRLSHVHRQGESSAALEASQQVLDGRRPPVPQEIKTSGMKGDFFWHDYPTTGRVPGVFEYLESAASRARGAGVDVRPEDVQLILPLRNPSSVDKDAYCTREANKTLQERFAQRRGAGIQPFPAVPVHRPSGQYTTWFATGDRVAHTGENGFAGEEESVMRGTVGYVTEADGEEERIVVEYPETMAIYEEPEELSQISLAWAITGHVSQGSEYEACAVALPKRGGRPLMTRSWLYTALTRSTGFMDLMATPERIDLCARRDASKKRQTLLSRAPGF